MAHTPALKQGEYLFKPLNVDNKFSAFLDKSNGVFTIYPHYKSATGAAFKFNKRVTVNLNFSALNTSSSGNVKFLILKNGMKVQEFDVRPKEITKRNIKKTIIGYFYKNDHNN